MHTPVNTIVANTYLLTYTWYTLNFVFPRRGANFKSNASFGSLGYYSSSCGYCKSKPRKTRQVLSVLFSRLHASSLLAASVLASLSHISLPLHLLYSSKIGLGFWLTCTLVEKLKERLTDWYSSLFNCLLGYAIGTIISSLQPLHYQILVDSGWRRYVLTPCHDLFQLGWKIGLRDTRSSRSGSFLYKPDGHNSCCPHYTIRYYENDSVYPLTSFLLTRQLRDWTHRLFSRPKTRERLQIGGITSF